MRKVQLAIGFLLMKIFITVSMDEHQNNMSSTHNVFYISLYTFLSKNSQKNNLNPPVTGKFIGYVIKYS